MPIMLRPPDIFFFFFFFFAAVSVSFDMRSALAGRPDILLFFRFAADACQCACYRLMPLFSFASTLDAASGKMRCSSQRGSAVSARVMLSPQCRSPIYRSPPSPGHDIVA